MRAENYSFIGFLASADFTDDVFLFDGAADLVGHREARPYFAGIGGRCARQAHGIFASKNRLRNAFQLPISGVGVAIEQHSLARTHPENCGGAGLYRAFNDPQWLRVLGKEVRPSRSELGVRE